MKIELYEMAEELNQLDELQVLNSKNLWQRLHFMRNGHIFSGDDYKVIADLFVFSKTNILKLRFVFGALPKHIFTNCPAYFADLLEFACNNEYEPSEGNSYYKMINRLAWCRHYFEKRFYEN